MKEKRKRKSRHFKRNAFHDRSQTSFTETNQILLRFPSIIFRKNWMSYKGRNKIYSQRY